MFFPFAPLVKVLKNNKNKEKLRVQALGRLPGFKSSSTAYFLWPDFPRFDSWIALSQKTLIEDPQELMDP